MGDFDVVVGSGTLRSADPRTVDFPHRWSEAGVTVQSDFTGGHLLHLAVAGCVLNDVYREAQRLGIEVHGVRVSATGAFETDPWRSTGIFYDVDIDSPAPRADLTRLLTTVDTVAEIPKAIRAGSLVERTSA